MHNLLALNRGKQKLRVRRVVDDDEFLGLGRSGEMILDPRQAQSGPRCIGAAHDKKLAARELFGVIAAFGAEKDDSFNFARFQLCVGIADSIAAKAAADGEDCL